MTHTPPWLAEAPIQRLLAATRDAGGAARVVGGAVRDFLMGVEGGDVDIASSLTPEQTMAIARAEGWKAIPTGIAHGTVTLVLPTRIVEVTTLRRDVTTDGRRATVAYTDSFEEDAARRDFTINALSMDEHGTLHDYCGGKEHLAAHAVCFIGDAATRIAEDGLRILRYFRFLATHGKPPADADALAAIKEKKAMIAQLSGERIAAEMKKLLAAENPAYVLRLMEETGVAPLVFGRSITPAAMIRLHMFEHQADYQCSVWARVVALLPNAVAADAEWLASRWKLSRHEQRDLTTLVSELPPPERGRVGVGVAPQFRIHSEEHIRRARELRQNTTEAEKVVWRILAQKQTGHFFRRQHPIGPYIADFVCTKQKLVIEIDGGQHAEQKSYDDARTTFLESEGYRVLRFGNNEVMENIEGVHRVICDALLQKTPTLPPPFRGRNWNNPAAMVKSLLRRHARPVVADIVLLAMAKALLDASHRASLMDLVHHFSPPVFPITAEDLLARGMTPGKALGDRLRLLEIKWEESDYTLSKDALLAGV